jgi:protein-S-isoprenylcysteine O-methyltransferase Ste14
MSVGRVLYGLAFCVLLPILLVAWAAALSAALPDLPAVRSITIGAMLVFAGGALMACAMWGLRTLGGGLPMNAFPPPRLVTRGLYRLTPHPIYVGFVLVCAGASLVVGSEGGLWIVTPLAALGCAALVLGFEHPDLERRFGPLPRPLISLPAAGDGAPRLWDRLSIFVLVLLPWLVAYEAIGHATPHEGLAALLPFERTWPVHPWTEWVYGSVYLLVLSAPLVARRTGDLRRFAIAGLVGTAVGSLVMLVVPLTSPPRPFEVSSFAGHLLELERADGLGVRGALPSFHVFWAIAAAWLIGSSRPRWALFA